MGRSPDWYALFVATGKEDSIKDYINNNFAERMRALVPKRKLRERKDGVWSNIIRTLFPGYVLLNGDISLNEYYQFREIPNVIRLLRSDSGPSRIDPGEVGIINRLISKNDIIDVSNVLIENGRVVVTEGPLMSMEGLIVNVNRRKGRAKVQLSLMGEPRIVELGISVLNPV